MTISTTTLKNAAKALGYDLWSDPDGSHYLVDYDGVKLKRWDPEHDNGDCLKLAIALGIEIHPDLEARSVSTAFMVGQYGYNEFAEFEDYDGNAMRAVRVVVLMSAARIGESL